MQRDISIQEALTLIDQHVQALPSRVTSVLAAQGCVAGEDLVARVDCPSATAALKDGFAVRWADLAGASETNPVTLRLLGQINAGQVELGNISPGYAMKVMTGARLPRGADAVLPSELAREETDFVVVCQPIKEGYSLLAHGRDVRAGAVLLSKGQILRPAACGLLAAAGLHEVPAFPRPTVSILATGDELAAPGQPLGPGQVYASNMVTLSAWLDLLRLPSNVQIVPDDMDAIVESMRDLNHQSDLLLTCGGAWKSGRDMTLSALDRLGWTPVFHRVRMGPGKAAAVGHLHGKPVICLPGGPPSNEMAFLKLAVPAIRRMAPWLNIPFVEIEATLTESVDGGTPGWTRFYQARLAMDAGGQWLVSPIRRSSRLHSQADAEAIIEVPEGVNRLEAGTRIVVEQLFPGGSHGRNL